MNHRPFCAFAAVGLLVAALAVGNPFRCAAPPVPKCPSPQGALPVLPVLPVRAPVSPVVLTDVHSDIHSDTGTKPREQVEASDQAHLPDPDGVGPCPEVGLPRVLRRGRDADGWATWWHADGTMTKRGVRTVAGEAVPFVMRLKPELPPSTANASMPASMPAAFPTGPH